MGKLKYYIGRLSENEQFNLDFPDGFSWSVYERIELGFMAIKLPVIDDESYRIIERENK